VKSIKPSPIGGADQPVTFSNLINSGTFGCVFAFDSYTTLETLAENLSEINSASDSDQWIDLVIVLDKGLVGYAFQAIMAEDVWAGSGDRQRMNFLSHLFMFISSKLPKKSLGGFEPTTNPQTPKSFAIRNIAGQSRRISQYAPNSCM
jgi:hypothetical protein